MRDRDGCLSGLLKLALLTWVFDELQDTFGFGQGCSGCGCGVILLIIFLALACSVCTGTNWLNLGF